MGCWFGFNYTFADLLATITESGFGGWVMCVCAEGINSSLNRPSHAHGLSSGNGWKWNDFLTATHGVSGFPRASRGSHGKQSGWRSVPSWAAPACGGFVQRWLLLQLQSLLRDWTAAFPLQGKEKGRVRGFGLGLLQPQGWWWFSSGEASRKGECAWLWSSTRAAGREDADYNNKQMPGIDYHTAVRAGGTRGGDPQRSFGGCSRILCWMGVFLLTQRKLLFRWLLMGLGFSVVQHLLGKAKRAGGAWWGP